MLGGLELLEGLQDLGGARKPATYEYVAPESPPKRTHHQCVS